MAQVSNESEFASALANDETLIELTRSFGITFAKTIKSTTTITSAAGGPYTLYKDAYFYNYLFNIVSNAAVTLTNIIIDGRKEDHSTETDSFSLILLTQGSLVLDEGAILQNNRAIEGGAISCAATDASNGIIMQRTSLISNNEVRDNGGAIYIPPESHCALRLSDDAKIVLNKSTGNGGGIYYASDLNDFIITGDASINDNTATLGGGIYTNASSCHIANQSEIFDNHATNGGGIYIQQSGFLVDHTVKIYSNEADEQGGGIYISQTEPIAHEVHGELFNNSANSGGAITCLPSANKVTLNLYEAHIHNNNTSGDSGGTVNILSSQGSVQLELMNTTFEENTSASNGSAISVTIQGDVAFLFNAATSQFTQNTSQNGSGCIYIDTFGGDTIIFETCTFSNNHATQGGALFLTHLSSLATNVRLTDTTFTDNNATLHGGAIQWESPSMYMTMDHVTMNHNVAQQNGGAIVLRAGSGRISIENNCIFENNEAMNGGAIYHGNQATLAITDSIFNQNSATNDGQDIYNLSSLTLGGNVQLQSGLYIEYFSSIPSISQDLSSDAFIQLEASDYLKPDPSGSPILIASANTDLTSQSAAAFRIPTTGFTGWTSVLGTGSRQIFISPIVYSLQYENTKGFYNPNPTFYTVVTPTITLSPLVTQEQFLGWFDAAQGGNKITEIPLGSTGDQTLYAYWELPPTPEHLVSYDANVNDTLPAQYIPSAQQVFEQSTFTISSLIPLRAQHSFLEWNTESDASGGSCQPSDTIGSIDIDLILYAIWQ